jgi:hypothetical protein
MHVAKKLLLCPPLLESVWGHWQPHQKNEIKKKTWVRRGGLSRIYDGKISPRDDGVGGDERSLFMHVEICWHYCARLLF